MSKRNSLITTSAIISLMLFNASTVYAETDQSFPADNQTNAVQEAEIQEEAGTDKEEVEYQELIEELKTRLNEEQQLILEELITNHPEILQEAFVHHQKGEFELAARQYETLLSDNEYSEETNAVLALFTELAKDHTYLTDYAPEEETNQETEEEKEAVIQSSESEEVAEPSTEAPQGQEFEEADETVDPEEKEAQQPATTSIFKTFSVATPQVQSESNVNYRGYLNNSSGTIHKTPGGEVIQNIGNLSGSEVKVLKEASTSEGTWLYIQVVGNSASGWVKQSNVDEESISEVKDVNYKATLIRTTDSINTEPWGTPGFQYISQVGSLVGNEVEVTKEAVTQRATWAYIHIQGTNISGWIDKAGLEMDENTSQEMSSKRSNIDTITSEKNVDYRAYLSRSKDTIDTRPWGTEGFQTIRTVGNLVGNEVRVRKEAVTGRATWAYVDIVGTNISGWIDKAGLEPEAVSSQKDVNYRAYLSRRSDSINTQPWGTPGFKFIGQVGDLVGNEVIVKKEAVTQRATWAYVDVVGTNISGWIDKAGLDPEAISSQKNVNYRAYLSRRTDSINTQPWGTPGFKFIGQVGNLVGNEVIVKKEAVTQRATWAYVDVVGKNISGWIDKAGLEPEAISSQKDVDYRGYLTRSTDSINTKPWGTPGFKFIRQVGDLKDREVQVTKEAVTQRATWAYVNVIGTNISGWVDKDGVTQATIAYRTTLYPITFEEALNRQMESGYPQTDAYGGGWKHAKREDVAYYLNPENFINDVKIMDTEYVQIATGALNVRKGPGTNYGKITTVSRNEVYDYLGESNGWVKIDVNGTDGWVSDAYVSKISQVQYKNLPNSRLAMVTASALNLRQGPSTDYDKVGLVYNGATYKVLDDSNGWYKLDANGTIGWASGNYLDISNEIESDKLQFLSLSSPSGISVADMNKELKGKGILENQGAAFIEASRRYNINEIYLLSHALLETGHGTSQLATGVKVNGTTVYNMFGIGAYDGNAVEAGSQYAYAQGWDTPAKAIVGGAKFIADSYINSPVHKQDTLYKMKWNPANPTTHQYATDIGWAVKQTNSLKMITEYSDKYNLVLKFDIPIYN